MKSIEEEQKGRNRWLSLFILVGEKNEEKINFRFLRIFFHKFYSILHVVE